MAITNDEQDAKAEVTAPAGNLLWPTEKWMTSPEKMRRKQHAIIVFLRRVWKPFIDDNKLLVTRKMLALHDPDAATALKEYVRQNPLPDDIRIVRTRDVNQLHAQGEKLLTP